MRKILSLLAVLALLMSMVMVVSAADTTIINSEVLNSITEEDETGLGLAFLYTMNLKNVRYYGNRTFDGATVTIDGVDYEVVKLGAIVSNEEEAGTDPDAMVIENANGAKLLNVEGKKMWEWDDTQVQYAVRITNIPVDYKKTNLYARPYYIYEKDGEEQVVYGAISNNSYFAGWCDANPITLPEIGSGIDVKYKTSNPDKCKRIRVEDTIQTVTEDGTREVTLTFKNYTSNWITEETDYVKYRCYDANGSKIQDGTIYIGCIDTKKNKTKSFTFEVPDNTAKVSILSTTKITYWTEWS